MRDVLLRDVVSVYGVWTGEAACASFAVEWGAGSGEGRGGDRWGLFHVWGGDGLLCAWVDFPGE